MTRSSVNIYGPAVAWIEAIPHGLRSIYLNRLIATSDPSNGGPISRDPPAKVFSVAFTPEASAKLQGVPNQSWAVQGIIEARIRAVEDAIRLHRASGIVEAARAAQFRVLGEEDAFGRDLGDFGHV